MSDYWAKFNAIDSCQNNLGGNLVHGDTRAITPKLWRYLVERFAIRSLLDVGAGEGHAAAQFARLGVCSHGFDGLERNVMAAKYPIALHDLENGPYIFPCDVTYCVEVVEHIDEKYIQNLLLTLTNAPVVIMTHGKPGQLGHNHVNNQPENYWVDKLEEHNYFLSIDNDHFRVIAKEDNPTSYFSESGLVFLKAV